MIYAWKPGAHQKIQASVVGKICEELEREGNLAAAALVEVSRPEDAPLHSAFEWRDDVAAEEWRRQQARTIIGALTVVSEQHEPVRAFVNLSVKSHEYTSIYTVVQDANSTELMLQNALRELKAFQTKYKNLTEFAGLFAEIAKLTA